MQNDMRDKLESLIDTFFCSVDIDKFYSQNQKEKLAGWLRENGVIAPPFKVGDKVYYLSGSLDRIVEKTIDEILINESKTDKGYYIHFASTYMPFEYIGKTVFLTKEQAEQKLKEIRVNNDK